MSNQLDSSALTSLQGQSAMLNFEVYDFDYYDPCA